MTLDLRGIIPACIVTFDESGRFDEAAYRRYLQWLLPQGPVGSSPSSSSRRSEA
jgi:dihydrodipicolinate synthase/N-acetylneuraminate lyase